jgi:hypothetical protein
MGCVGDDDVVRDATIEELSQAVFSASPLGALGGYIIRRTKLNSVKNIRGLNLAVVKPMTVQVTKLPL